MKKFITPDELRKDSISLATQIFIDGFIPDFEVAVWRGGATPGKIVHEGTKYMCANSKKYKGQKINIDHIAIRTSKYYDIDKSFSTVQVHNLGYLIERLTKDSKVLLVDDVFDTGLSMQAILDALKEKLGENMPIDIRIATIHFKPSKK